jgi:crossover junction endodeoxyribonuclease RuvC
VGSLILGIDPGTTLIGYGLLDFENDKPRAVDCGVIRVRKKYAFQIQLQQIYREVTTLLEQTNPQVVAIEEVYVSQNAKTTLRLGHARGVILLAAVNKGISVTEFAPREVKQAVCGNGNASKQQIQWMVANLLHLDAAGLSEDAADAMAVALCCGLRNCCSQKTGLR